jgi:GTP 3',8-cyclase
VKDRLGREIEYLRVSVTQNCNLKCIYCASDEKNCITNDSSTITAAEIEAIVRSAAKAGIKKVRVTGGEPLVRHDVCDIVQRISRIDGISDVSMTTNGINLDRLAEGLKNAGLKRLNVSIDSLDSDKYAYITGRGKLEDALKGIQKSLSLGLSPVKINTVLIKGVNDNEIDDFIRLAKDSPLEVRFIELMPIGKFGEENSDKMILNSDIIAAHPELIFLKESLNGQPTTYYTIDGYKGKIGFISPLSHKFCDRCNRIRLTCDGKIRPCLGNNGEVDVISVLRQTPEIIDDLIRKIIYEKPEGHHFENSFSSVRNMSMIGG